MGWPGKGVGGGVGGSCSGDLFVQKGASAFVMAGVNVYIFYIGLKEMFDYFGEKGDFSAIDMQMYNRETCNQIKIVI